MMQPRYAAIAIAVFLLGHACSVAADDAAISATEKWLAGTVWKWGDWREVTFDKGGNFRAPTRDCEFGHCRWKVVADKRANRCCKGAVCEKAGGGMTLNGQQHCCPDGGGVSVKNMKCVCSKPQPSCNVGKGAVIRIEWGSSGLHTLAASSRHGKDEKTGRPNRLAGRRASDKHRIEATFVKALKPDYYAQLGVEPDASQADIRRAYRRLSLQFHPDKRGADSGRDDGLDAAAADARFKEISEAYETLGDPEKRALHDSMGGETFFNQHQYERAKRQGRVSDNLFGLYRLNGPVHVVGKGGEDVAKFLNAGPALLEFYAPWCVHCQHMSPHYKSAAILLDGVARVGAMDCSANEGTCNRFGVHSYPSIFFYKNGIGSTGIRFQNKQQHVPEDFVDFVDLLVNSYVTDLDESAFNERLVTRGPGAAAGGGPGGDGGGGDGDGDGDGAVADGPLPLWVVDFSAGDWCGPCTMAKNSLQKLARDLKGIAHVGLVDCDSNKEFCGRMDVTFYPQFRLFGGAHADAGTPADKGASVAINGRGPAALMDVMHAILGRAVGAPRTAVDGAGGADEDGDGEPDEPDMDAMLDAMERDEL